MTSERNESATSLVKTDVNISSINEEMVTAPPTPEEQSSTENHTEVNLSRSQSMTASRTASGRRKSLARSLGLTPTTNPHIYSKWEKKQMRNFSSIMYHHSRSEAYQDFLLSTTSSSSGTWWKWFFFVAIGVMMSLTAYVLKAVTETINEARKEHIALMLGSQEILEAYFFHVGLSLAFVLVAAWVVIYWEPSAAGSGIPEVIGYLNGVHIPNIFTPKVYFAKMISVICSVVSGLPLGPEGPMIHIGGTIGASVESRNTLLQKIVPWYQFRNQEDKRQFVLGGVAAGVSAAFNAPIGGLAFAWEEISTFWEDKQAWMILFGCMFSAFVTNLLLSITFDINHAGYFTRGTILFFVPSVSALGVWIFIPAIVIGSIGGILGVIFTWIALFLGRLRRTYRKFFKNKLVKLAEPLLISLLFMSIGFFFPFAFPCLPYQRNTSNTTEVGTIITNETHSIIDTNTTTQHTLTTTHGEPSVNISFWTCEEGYYNSMAELSLLPGHEIIQEMLSRDNVGAFSYLVLVVFLIYYFLFAAWIAGGVSLASGVVVPMITIGATYGRIIGKIMMLIIPHSDFNTPGVYALLGSAAFFAGVTRLSVSLTIIMIELSGDVLMAFPLMVSIMVAKNIADLFIHPLYHEQLALKGVPYLDSPSSIVGIETLRVNDVMTGNVVALAEVESISIILKSLDDYDFSSFPVVSKDTHYEGMIQRREIKFLLTQHDLFLNKKIDRPNRILSWFDLKSGYNSMKKGADFDLNDDEKNKFLDLTPYINTGIFSVPLNFFLKDAYTLFRTMALTHIIVVNHKHQLVGIITRKDLLGDNISVKQEKKKRQLKNKIKRVLKKDRETNE